MQDLEERILSVRVYRESDSPALHKPLLLLYAIGRLARSGQRMIPFVEIDAALHELLKRFSPDASTRSNTHYPFGKLENDGIWEVEQSSTLQRTAAGHLLKSELIDRQISAGFNADAFNELLANRDRALAIASALASKYFIEPTRSQVLDAVGLNVGCGASAWEGGGNHRVAELNGKEDKAYVRTGGAGMVNPDNGFLAYLNSLHNLTASGANALAESQALNSYFGELYEPFPLADPLKALLADGKERVVILTGHAGDGKSSVALDVLKALRGIPATDPLDAPLKEVEAESTPAGPVTVVKDMSELGAEDRQEHLRQAFQGPGSWLIVSNTGPLLNSLRAYKGASGPLGNFESRVLRRLNEPLREDALDEGAFHDFGKLLLILNLTRLDNVELGARLLTKLVRHSGWQGCAGCPIEKACPLALNRLALLEAGPVPEERVRWIYRRINDYEQRLTLRQMVAQLAYGLTGGMGCSQARSQVEASTAAGADRGTGALQEIVFSEGFFGYRRGKPRPQADALQAVALLRRARIGGPVAPDFERQFALDAGAGWATLPDALLHLGALWRKRALEAEGVPARGALRRLVLIFGQPRPDRMDVAAVFLDASLRSPSLRELDAWQREGRFTLSRGDLKRLRSGCLDVLLEAYSGFSAGQFRDVDNQLYLTLRRPDRAVVQPTQLILASLPLRAFDLEFDAEARLPKLRYRGGSVVLELPLPLLDYIRRRDAGELGNGLSPIHQAQLDRFQAELLKTARDEASSAGEVAFLRAGIAGDVAVYRYFLDETTQTLERE